MTIINNIIDYIFIIKLWLLKQDDYKLQLNYSNSNHFSLSVNKHIHILHLKNIDIDLYTLCVCLYNSYHVLLLILIPSWCGTIISFKSTQLKLYYHRITLNPHLNFLQCKQLFIIFLNSQYFQLKLASFKLHLLAVNVCNSQLAAVTKRSCTSQYSLLDGLFAHRARHPLTKIHPGVQLSLHYYASCCRC